MNFPRTSKTIAQSSATGKPLQFRPIGRSRLQTATILSVVIAAGIICRAFPTRPLVRKDLADALWALAIYLFVRLLSPGLSVGYVTVAAAGIAFGIEFLKLVHVAWLETVRATWVGGVFLGRYFHTGDLIRCAAGIAAGVLWDWKILQRNRK